MMPTSRSNTSSRPSRSPAPPTQSPSTPRSFQPPSYYAAAAAYASCDSRISRRSDETTAKGKSVSRTHKEVRSGRQITREAPLPYEQATPSDSDSSALITRDNPHETSGLIHRESRTAYPDLEAHLLPTLRDTVDRMTRTPSRMSTHQAGREDSEMWKRDTRSHSRRISPEARSTQDLRQNTPREAPFQLYRHHSEEARTPNLSDIYSKSNQSTPTLETNQQRPKIPAKSALKSSLRSPMPQPTPRMTPMPATSSPSMAGSSLRSMKSLLSRKCSETLKSPFNGGKDPDKSKKSEKYSSPSRRGNDSGPSTPGPKRDFQSSIPRPRGRHHGDTNLEDSDFEQRFEIESRDRRQLTVTNAEIFVSGSSSESDAESRQRVRQDDRRNGPGSGRADASVGLGLSFPSSPNPLRQRWEEHRSRESSKTRMQPTPARPAVPPEKSLRFSLPPSESAGSTYSDDPGPTPPPRRAALMLEIFRVRDALARAKSPSTPSWIRRPNYQIMSYEEMCPVAEGLSQDRQPLRNTRTQSKRKRRSQSERDTPSDVPGIKARRNGGVRASACQQYAPEKRRSSQVFPPNLKELIKSRHSFSKSPSSRTEPDLPASSKRKSAEFKAQEKPYGKSAAFYTNSAGLRQDDSRRRFSREKTEATAIIDQYRSAAARERLAFGIPPSESDEAIRREHEQHLTHAESDMSSLNESVWQDECEELSLSAESILKTLDEASRREAKRNMHQRRLSPPRLSVISPSSASSTCEDLHESSYEPHMGQSSHSHWEVPDSGPSHHQPLIPQEPPRTREGVIQEIFESEEELLQLLHICMRMFVLPLRVANSHAWVAGVPPNIARLLDWFDDIVNLHEQIYASLCSARDTMSPATDRVSESLRCFVMKVEVYQPYLVRLADVSQEIVGLTQDERSDFGQFVSMQEREEECMGWSFERLLMLPVNRLAAYQDLFSRMLDLTPKNHQDYLSTFSLSRSTDMVIKVMTEVKLREDEYMLLKAFSARIQGLPASGGIATRERRLLHSGPLCLVISNLSPNIGPHVVKAVGRVGRSNAMTEFERFGTLKVVSSKSSDGSKTAAEKACSTLAPSTKSRSSWFSRLPLRKRSRTKSPTQQETGRDDDSTRSSPDPALRTVDVHAFVFNDLVLLAQSMHTPNSDPSWLLCEDLSVFRPLSIARIRRRNQQEGMMLSLEALQLDPVYLNEPSDFRTSSVRVVDLLLPPPGPTSAKGEADLTNNEVFQPWLLSLRQCCKATLRKLTFVGPSSKDGAIPGSDLALDTQSVLRSLVGSGLPIPRSPSGQFPDAEGLDFERHRGQGEEREERGWWSLRYQQVFREFQRQDSLLSDDEDED
ncbi:hypothetical protein NLJ89_g8144 [Agrocybe chaxingu]|uniref:DH domain-containing protein n=1 Tax=Agrocybe chaxingu TaxID=84603 RepID=A0A9W8JUZ8_9AGAR|nr:hypothetical protein NLJ89_g8144 [Agrocybe chaxingu]